MAPKTKVTGTVLPPEEKKRYDWLAPFQFRPGASGNPSGRPKKKPITDRMLAQLERIAPEETCEKLGLPVGSTYGDCAVARTLIQAIIGRDVSHLREVADRTEGKATQSLNVNLSTTDVLAERLRAARKRRDNKK